MQLLKLPVVVPALTFTQRHWKYAAASDTNTKLTSPPLLVVAGPDVMFTTGPAVSMLKLD